MIGILDFGIGNHFSILKIFQKLKIEAELVADPCAIPNFKKLILPGVGNIASCMEALNKSGLLPPTQEAVFNKQIPILGICVGMQMLSDFSEEGETLGLGWINGRVRRFPNKINSQSLRVPHVGWNNVEGRGPLFQSIEANTSFYFTHSYYFDCVDSDNIAATTNYGLSFASAVQKGHIYGVQFHPEKSHAGGVQLLKNFAENC